MFGRTDLRRALTVLALSAAAVVLVVHAFRWLRSNELFFFADETVMVGVGGTTPYREMVSLLPDTAMASRPLGLMFSRLLYQVFGLNYHAQSYAFVGVHLLNVFLAYLLLARLLGSRLFGYLGAVFYGTFFPALFAAFGVGAPFDMLAMTCVLLSFLTFLQPSRLSHVLSILFYYLAMRAKISVIGLPLILTLHLLTEPGFRWSWSGLGSIVRRCGVHYLIMLVHLGAQAYASHVTPFAENHPYYVKYTDQVFFQGLAWYLTTLGYGREPASLACLLFLGGVAASLWARWRPGILGGVGFVIGLLPVLFLVNHHEYAVYLYCPSLYIVLALMGAAQDGAALVIRRTRLPAALVTAVAAAGVLACAWQAPRTQYAKDEVERYTYYRRPMARIHQMLVRQLPVVEPGASFYFRGIPPQIGQQYRFFDDGQRLFRLMYHDSGIDCYVEDGTGPLWAKFQAEARPRYLIDYRDGNPALQRCPASKPESVAVASSAGRVEDSTPAADRR